MKGFVACGLLLAFVCLAESKATKEVSDKLRAAIKKCGKDHNLDSEKVDTFIKLRKLPETQDGKCALLCYMKEMKYVENDKVVLENIKKSNAEKWDDSAVVEKANKVMMACKEEIVPNDENIDCEKATSLFGCLKKGIAEHSIPTPELS